MTNYINEKIEILRDLCILRPNAKRQESAIRDILGDCRTEIQIDQLLHNVLCGKETLKELIARKS